MRLRLVRLALAVGLVACAAPPEARVEARLAPPDVACALDGMLLAYHDGPKAQLLGSDGERRFYCDTREAFEQWLAPGRRRQVAGLWFQTLDDGVWEAHADGWSRADSLWFVAGSRRLGAMGPTLVPFRARPAADAFVATYGGRVLRFDQVDAGVLESVRRQGLEQLGRDAGGG